MEDPAIPGHDLQHAGAAADVHVYVCVCVCVCVCACVCACVIVCRYSKSRIECILSFTFIKTGEMK